jgi:RNA polymerase sigma-70 factor, ECF subfamily
MSDNGQKAPVDNAPPDFALIQQIATGDSRALEMLYQRHGLALLRYLTGQLADRAQAEEVLQDVMFAVWRGAAEFRGESHVYTWLISIAHNRAINARTRLPHDNHEPIDRLDTMVATTPPLIDSLLEQLEQVQVRAALSHLPAAQRETLELVFYHALNGPEAARVLGIAQGTVKSRLHRALITLRQLLKEARIARESE